jgi:hypothetical protein
MALTDNLISCWELEEASGTRFDAVVASANDLGDNNTVTQATGKVGNCAHFTSANTEFLNKASNASLQVSGSFSVAVWVKFTSVTTAGFIAKQAGSGGSGVREYYLAYAAGYGFNFSVRNSADTTSSSAIHAGGGATTATWYFITGVFDAAGPTVHVNRNAGTRTSIAGPAAAYVGTNQVCLGSFSDGTLLLNGDLDQVCFWNRAITTGEETTLYNGGAGLSYAAMGGVGGGPVIPVFMNQYRRVRTA